MPRSIWGGAISFGLVNVPVKLMSAVQQKDVRFHQLEASTNARVKQKRVSAETGDEVPYENIIKGYEVAPDQYVAITPEELESLDPKKTKSIDIEDFVDLHQIDPVYFDKPYYLAPDTGAEKPYKLLLEALKETNKVAIARVVIRSKEYLTAIRAAGDVLTLETMLFSDELIDPDSIDELPDADVRATEREVDMARQLIESLATDFDPAKYRDEYRERVLELIEQKASGQEVAVAAEPEAPAAVPDLMAALEASLAAAKGGREKIAATGNGAAKKNAKAAAKADPKPAAKKKPAPKRAAAKKPRAKSRA